ncbi:MAG: flavodoxin domain-containing protein [Anaerolineae bacterium]|nr:flavodoxin domain-containing protein [Anaerolineae bacterium]
MKILSAYASAHGSTGEIAHFIGQVFKEHDHEVTIAEADHIASVAEYDAFILGSPIHGGMWLTEISRFIARHESQLAAKPVFFYITCIRVLEADGYEHAQGNYLYHEVLEDIGVKVQDVGIFAGKLDLETIDWRERWTLSLRYDGHEVPGTLNQDFRDWNAIRGWVNKVLAQLEQG